MTSSAAVRACLGRYIGHIACHLSIGARCRALASPIVCSCTCKHTTASFQSWVALWCVYRSQINCPWHRVEVLAASQQPRNSLPQLCVSSALIEVGAPSKTPSLAAWNKLAAAATDACSTRSVIWANSSTTAFSERGCERIGAILE